MTSLGGIYTSIYGQIIVRLAEVRLGKLGYVILLRQYKTKCYEASLAKKLYQNTRIYHIDILFPIPPIPPGVFPVLSKLVELKMACLAVRNDFWIIEAL